MALHDLGAIALSKHLDSTGQLVDHCYVRSLIGWEARTVTVEKARRGRDPLDGYLLFEVGDHTCAIPVTNVIEVLAMAALSPEPGSPEIVAGFLNLDGDAIPVLHLLRLIESADAPSEIDLNTPLVLVRHAELRVGLIVSRVLRIVWASAAELTSLPGSSLAVGALQLEGRLVPVLQLEAILLEEERERLETLQAAHRRRLDNLLEAGV